MNEMKASIDLLRSVYLTMGTISVVGIDNQDKFVGCAQAVKTVEKQISDYIASAEARAEKTEDASDGRKDG